MNDEDIRRQVEAKAAEDAEVIARTTGDNYGEFDPIFIGDTYSQEADEEEDSASGDAAYNRIVDGVSQIQVSLNGVTESPIDSVPELANAPNQEQEDKYDYTVDQWAVPSDESIFAIPSRDEVDAEDHDVERPQPNNTSAPSKPRPPSREPSAQRYSASARERKASRQKALELVEEKKKSQTDSQGDSKPKAESKQIQGPVSRETQARTRRLEIADSLNRSARGNRLTPEFVQGDAEQTNQTANEPQQARQEQVTPPVRRAASEPQQEARPSPSPSKPTQPGNVKSPSAASPVMSRVPVAVGGREAPPTGNDVGEGETRSMRDTGAIVDSAENAAQSISDLLSDLAEVIIRLDQQVQDIRRVIKRSLGV